MFCVSEKRNGKQQNIHNICTDKEELRDKSKFQIISTEYGSYRD
jgi:hypothetical protein